MGDCKVCGLGLVQSEEAEGVCFKCKGKMPAEEIQAMHKERDDAIANMLVTTEVVTQLNVVKRIEVVTAECVFGMNVFKDFFVGVSDIFGGRSNTTQQVLRDARKKVLEELKNEAYEVGANAVVAVSLSYNQMSGKGSSMLFVVATGTAVLVE